MSIYINIEEFRQYHVDVIACRDVLNEFADRMSDEKNHLEYLRNIIYSYSHEMVEKLIANAVLNDEETYNEDITAWAENVRTVLFMYETQEVLQDYIPDKLDSALIEKIVFDLIDEARQRDFITLNDGEKVEIITFCEPFYLLGHTNADNDTLYVVSKDSLDDITSSEWDSSPLLIKNIFFRYQDALEMFTSYAYKDDLVFKKLTEEYNQFRNEMLSSDPRDIYDRAFKIVSIEDLYYILTEGSYEFTEAQKDYIINNEYSTLKTIYEEWRDTDYNQNDEMRDTIGEYFRIALRQTDINEIEDSDELEG